MTTLCQLLDQPLAAESRVTAARDHPDQASERSAGAARTHDGAKRVALLLPRASMGCKLERQEEPGWKQAEHEAEIDAAGPKL